MCTSRRSVSDNKSVRGDRNNVGVLGMVDHLAMPLGPGAVAPMLRLRPDVPFGAARPMVEE